MPLTLKEFREKYPQYDNVSDQKLAEGLHRKYYSNVPFDEFAGKIGYKSSAETSPVSEPAPATTIEKPDRSWYEVSGGKLTKGFGTQIAEGAKQGLGGVSQAAIDALPNSIDQLPPGLSYEEVDRLGGVREYYAQVYGITSNEQLKQIKAQATQNITARRKASEARTAEATPEDLTLLESGLRGGAESIARNLPGIAASIATGSPIPTLTSAGLQTGAESYGQARAEGLSPTKAARFAGIDATIEIATELLPTKWLLGAVGANSLSGVKKELLKFAAGEMTGEQLATLGQSINAYANALDQELAQAQTLDEKAEIQGRRQALTAIATLVSSGTFAGGVGAAAKIADISRERAESRRVADELSRSAAIRALDPNTYDPTLVSPAQTIRPSEIVSGEPAAPPGRPRPSLMPEVGTALEGLAATELPPEVIEGVPPAVVDSARDILTLVDEGKAINLFRARSLARQLGVDLPNNANKETTLTALREAVALIAAPPAAVEPASEVTTPEAAKPRVINPFLTPEQQGLTPEEAATLEAAAPETARVEPVQFVAPSDFRYTIIESPNYDLAPLSPEDADFELEVLQQQAERGRLTPQNFAQSEIGARLDTVQIGTVNDGLRSDPVNTIKALREKLAAPKEAPTAEVPSEPARESISEPVVEPSGRGTELPVPRVGAAGPEVAGVAPVRLDRVSGAPERVDEGAEAGQPALEQPRIFESIEDLNIPLPAVTEQLARERAPSLRRELGKSLKDYAAGRLNGDRFAETTGDLLLRTQKERIVRPRKRGADFIRERLFNAARNGYLNPEGVDIAAWFIQQNLALVEDLGISVRIQPEGERRTAAFYDPINRIITLFKSKGNEETATHEILHHLERLMPENIRANILKAYVKQLTKALKNAKTDEERLVLETLLNHHFGQASLEGYKAAFNAIKFGRIPYSNYQYVSPSEFWAVNGSRIVQGRYGIPPGVVGQIKRWLREFLEKIKDLLGLTSDAPIIRALDSLSKADGRYKTDEMLGTAATYFSVEPPPKDIFEVRKRAMKKSEGPSIFQKISQQFEGHGLYKGLVRKFADVAEPIMGLDRDKARAGYLIKMGPDRNDIASELVRSPNIADFIISRRVEPVERKIQSVIKAYARMAGLSVEAAVNDLDSLMIALHEVLRRETAYLRNVGLRNDIRLPAGSLPFAQDQPAMTPADYREYLEGLRSKLPPDQAAQIQDVMRVIVDKFKTSRGFSPKAVTGKPTPLDINDKFYDVVPRKIEGQDAYTPQILAAARNKYNNLDPDMKAAVDAVRAALAEMHALERELNREAYYWAPQVDSVIASYQWGDTYVPFQGIPDSDSTLDYNSKKLSGELTETAQAWDGRETEFDSPILQSIDNAKRAAGRVSRKDLINVTLVNNINQDFIRVKSKDPEVYTFDDRRSPDFDFSVLEGAGKVLVYQPNGDIQVYELKEKPKLDALKKAYRKLNPWLETLLTPVNYLTNKIGQYHTRFNIAFAPMDFFTNTMTNFGLISTGKGGVQEGAKYIAQTLSNVARSGLFTKAANLSRALSSKDPRVLDRLMQSKDSFYREAADFIRLGGRSLYRQAMGIGVQLDQLVSAVGPGRIMKTGEQVARLFDIYGDMFELTSRLAAYTTHLKDITAKAKLEGVDVENPEVQEALKREATTFALELMNFRKMGEWGRVLSSLYMFFKPGATSAKLAYDAVRKGLINAESALKNADPAVWAKLNSVYELQELEAEQAKPRPNQQKITELQNAIQANDDAKQKFLNSYNMERNNAQVAIPLFFATGALYYLIAQMFAEDDDEGRNKISTDEMSRWTRYARMPIPGEENFFQVPWGYGVGAFPAAGAQFAALFSGNLSLSDFLANMIEIGLDSYMPFPASRTNPFDNTVAWIAGTIAPTSARGFIEYAFNLDSLGNPIYNSRIGKYSDAYSGTARAGELHNWIADQLFGMSKGTINWNPNTIAYAMNTYADGVNVLAEGAFGLSLVLKDEKDIDLKKDVPVFKRFIGRMSNFDAREFSEAERWILKEAPKYKTFRDIRSPEEFDEYLERNPTVPVIVDMYDQVLNGSLSQLSEQRKLVMRDRDLTMKQRQEYLDEIDYDINAIKRNFVESYREIREEEKAGD